jgi:dTMP kinase
VVSDRFVRANVVYQGHAGGLDPEELWQVGRISTGGLLPDLTVVLDLPVELARARLQGEADRMERRPPEYHEYVREGFQAEAWRHPERIRLVDASPPAEVVQARIRELVEPLLS